MRFTLNSRKFNRSFTFILDPKSGYIYLGDNQICYGGGFSGDTIDTSTTNPEKFARICRRWWRAALRGGVRF